MFTLIPTRKAVITAAIALFGAVTAFAQTGSLAGLVTDESTKKPIEGVTIEVYKTDFKAKSLARFATRKTQLTERMSISSIRITNKSSKDYSIFAQTQCTYKEKGRQVIWRPFSL